MIDLYTSRRKAFLECEYWNQMENEYIVPASQIEHEQIPSGFFTAEIVSNLSEANQTIENVFLLQETSLTITTFDDISDLKINDIVKINDGQQIFRVDTINKEPLKKQTQFFLNGSSFQYFIKLRG